LGKLSAFEPPISLRFFAEKLYTCPAILLTGVLNPLKPKNLQKMAYFMHRNVHGGAIVVI
jgi:hypothetical protein